jgi:tetracycline repressor-like protein
MTFHRCANQIQISYPLLIRTRQLSNYSRARDLLHRRLSRLHCLCRKGGRSGLCLAAEHSPSPGGRKRIESEHCNAAGLTHGGFYRHFASKDQLVLEACSETVFSLIARPGIAHQRKASPACAWAHCGSICVARPSQPAENRLPPGRSGELARRENFTRALTLWSSDFVDTNQSTNC